MKPTRSGIIAGGNWILDHVKILDHYPNQDALGNILSQSVGNGGSPYNILKDLHMLGAHFPLAGIGLLGNDANGAYILEDCKKSEINTDAIILTDHAATSYTDVMSVKSTGRRTFFHQRGANALLDIPHFEGLKDSTAKIFHLGYLLLLDKLDLIDQKGRTAASYLFEQAKSLGFKTSTDVVSESSDRFKQVVLPSLPFIDYLFVNEYEAEHITGVAITEDEQINIDKAIEAARMLLTFGVNEWVILHFPKGAVAVSAGGVVVQPSLNVPADKIAGAAGAGDAFAAGTIFGLHEGWDMAQCLRLGVSAAASSLAAPSCSDGVVHFEQALALSEELGFVEMLKLV